MNELIPSPSEGDFLFYATEDGITRVRLLVDGQTVWMPQSTIAELFESTKQNIGQHIRKIFEDNELRVDSVVKNYFTTASDGKQYQTKHYSLDMILAIGYRVRSPRGTRRRPSHADRLKTLKKQVLEETFSRLPRHQRAAQMQALFNALKNLVA